ncbi:hypothetical protein EHS25_001783 [Saitozyma podzolica]|uniref:Uncharacterized protein n=1 Tax=Saitozyma podzolica TaxID=1890683 RepID=A0A427YFN8_9TREE|nr:hypothetical protein EHS25_001783 [Saitozyma podzolica]
MSVPLHLTQSGAKTVLSSTEVAKSVNVCAPSTSLVLSAGGEVPAEQPAPATQQSLGGLQQAGATIISTSTNERGDPEADQHPPDSDGLVGNKDDSSPVAVVSTRGWGFDSLRQTALE